MVTNQDDQDLARLLTGAWTAREAGSPAKAVAAMARARRTSLRWRRGRLIAVTVGALALAGFVVRPLLTERPPLLAVIAAVAATDGRGQPLHVGDRLPAGAVVRTAEGGRVDLVTRRGSELALNGDSELVLAHDGRSVDLHRGQLYLRNRDKEFATVTTEAGRIELLGTTINAAIGDRRTVAVTVVEGKVRLVNDRGQAVVEAGKRSMLSAANAPQAGASVNVAAELAWYHGRNNVLSDFGDIVYTIYPAKALYTEIWVMRPDGSEKHRLRSYLGTTSPGASGWLPGAQQLLIATRGVVLGAPDPRTRTIDTNYGHPMMGDELWLLNAATGQSTPTNLPYGFAVRYSQISPDGSRAMFLGSYKPDPRSFEGHEGGIWIYDFATGELRKLVDGWLTTTLAWSPDGRNLVVSSAEEHGYDHLLALIDAATGEVTNLGLSGSRGAFSPDGTKLAYCGGFAPSSGSMQGVPMSGSIWVADLVDGGAGQRISPPQEGALHPQWSPDGRRVAYIVVRSESVSGRRKFHSRLSVAEADGLGVITLGEFDAWIRAFAWAPSGDMVYAVTDSILGSGGVLAIAADGSGRVTDLGGTVEDSLLSEEDRRQTEGAVRGLQEAFFQFVSGEIAQGDGKLTESRSAFRAAAEIFAGITWRYPRSGFSPDDVIRYADEAIRRAEEPAASALHQACRQRMDTLSGFLWRFASENDRFPHDLAELRAWMVEVRDCEPEEIAPLFSCPVGVESSRATPYGYNSRASQGHLSPGEAIVSCPEHPDLSIAWDRDFLMRRGEVVDISPDQLDRFGDVP